MSELLLAWRVGRLACIRPHNTYTRELLFSGFLRSSVLRNGASRKMLIDRTHVLFVEDNPLDAKMIETFLAQSSHVNFALRHVTDLATALPALRDGAFDAVLLDLMLPDSLGGIETIRAIHAIHREIPIVILTGRQDTELALTAVREGAQDYLVKEQCNAESVVRAVRYAIERVRHTIDERALREACHQLEIGGAIQQAKFPCQSPDVPGYDIAGLCIPAAATGGDYFDYLPMDPGYLGIAVGDASGHGLGPAMVMSDVRAILRTLITIYSDVGEIMRWLNRIAVRDLNVSMFMTLFLVRLQPDSGCFDYAGAGHTAFILNEYGDLRAELRGVAPPLNVIPELELGDQRTEQLQPGETLLLCTDGIHESHAQSSFSTLFGEQRMLDLVRTNYHHDAASLASQIVQAAQDFAAPDPQDDDMTVVLVRRLCETPTAAVASRTIP